jgi:hypothetical protein
VRSRGSMVCVELVGILRISSVRTSLATSLRVRVSISVRPIISERAARYDVGDISGLDISVRPNRFQALRTGVRDKKCDILLCLFSISRAGSGVRRIHLTSQNESFRSEFTSMRASRKTRSTARDYMYARSKKTGCSKALSYITATSTPPLIS